VEYELGSIQVTAELQDRDNEEVSSFSDVTSKYEFLRDRPKEHFYAVFLKSDNEVIGDKLIGLGNTSTASIDTKDVARTAVLTNATAVILVHNHPSTNDKATDQDIETTQRIEDALDLFGVEVLDHVIISQTDSYSMKHNGDI
jgi:DNA repair protein RadC